jgi:hypothetical protein
MLRIKVVETVEGVADVVESGRAELDGCHLERARPVLQVRGNHVLSY